MCRSDRCRRRIGQAPLSSTGRSRRRSVNRFGSALIDQARVAAPMAASEPVVRMAVRSPPVELAVVKGAFGRLIAGIWTSLTIGDTGIPGLDHGANLEANLEANLGAQPAPAETTSVIAPPGSAVPFGFWSTTMFTAAPAPVFAVTLTVKPAAVSRFFASSTFLPMTDGTWVLAAPFR